MNFPAHRHARPRTRDRGGTGRSGESDPDRDRAFRDHQSGAAGAIVGAEVESSPNDRASERRNHQFVIAKLRESERVQVPVTDLSEFRSERVEQKLVYPFLVHPSFMDIPPEWVRTKEYMEPTEIDKMAIVNQRNIWTFGADEDALTTSTQGEHILNSGNLTTAGDLGTASSPLQIMCRSSISRRSKPVASAL